MLFRKNRSQRCLLQHVEDRKYLKFIWKDKLYEFTCLPNGLSTASRIFTKVLKPLFSALRKTGHTNVAYIDDSLLQSDTFNSCKQNVKDTLDLVDSLGLTAHPEKSVALPSQTIEFVGFVLNSVDMTVRLSYRKAQDIKQLASNIIQKQLVPIRQFAKLIGKFVAAEPGVPYAALYYKQLELDRDAALKEYKGDFDAKMVISKNSKECISWWIQNIETSFRPISHGPPNRKIESDSSLIGYGGHDITNNCSFSGRWKNKDKKFHINYLELKAAFLNIKYFCESAQDEHVHLFLDNMVAIKYLNKMGGRKYILNELTRKIWKWCAERNIWITVFHIPTKMNIRADTLSRVGKALTEDMEWALDQSIFELLQLKMGKCDTDLFASANNHKLDKYISYMPDKKAYAVNAFSISWKHEFNYAFPPFSQLGHLLQKMCEDNADMIVIAPIFPSQPWFPRLLEQISGQCYVLPRTHQILQLPGTTKTHRLTKMRLAAFKLSGNPLCVQDYQSKLQTSSCMHGDQQQQSNMGLITRDGCSFVTRHKLIQLIHL